MGDFNLDQMLPKNVAKIVPFKISIPHNVNDIQLKYVALYHNYDHFKCLGEIEFVKNSENLK